jgi:hypothetical protein
MDITTIDPDFSPVSYTVGGTSAQSSTITTGSGIIRIAVRGGHAHIKFGVNPVATDDDILIPENHVEFFSFVSGQKVAFIHVGGGSAEMNIAVVD